MSIQLNFLEAFIINEYLIYNLKCIDFYLFLLNYLCNNHHFPCLSVIDRIHLLTVDQILNPEKRRHKLNIIF